MNGQAGDPRVIAALQEIGIDSDVCGPTLNTVASARAVETIGIALAGRLRAARPTGVAIWDSMDEAVLAHVVARELGVTATRAHESSGVVSFSPGPEPGARLAVIATLWKDPQRLEVLLSMAAHRQATVVAVSAVVSSPALDDVRACPVMTLVTPDSVFMPRYRG